MEEILSEAHKQNAGKETYKVGGATVVNRVLIRETQIGRDTFGRGVAASASDPVTVGDKKRGDEVTARQPLTVSVESPRPPQPISADEVFGPTGNSKAKEAFERAQYQKIYMRHKPKAKLEGLSVKEWRIRHAINWKDEL